MRTIDSRVRAIALAATVLGAASLAGAAAEHHQAHDAPAIEASSKAALRTAMRRVWSDHVIWTREYVVAAIDGPEGAAAAAAGRLMKNQEDIGAAVASYYGPQAGGALTSLLKEHITLAVDIVAAAKAGDQPRTQTAEAKWTENANAIAAFLSAANPHWPRQALADGMRMHLETTTQEVLARLHKDYAQDVAAFDAVYAHILQMADVLSDGIIQQFPDRFTG